MACKCLSHIFILDPEEASFNKSCRKLVISHIDRAYTDDAHIKARMFFVEKPLLENHKLLDVSRVLHICDGRVTDVAVGINNRNGKSITVHLAGYVIIGSRDGHFISV